MTQIDKDGTVFVFASDDDRYRYKLWIDEKGQRVLLRDDDYRIYSMNIEKNAENTPIGEREWDLLWEYKHCDAPGHQSIVEAIMTGSISKNGEKA